MGTTENYGYNVPVGSDNVNLLPQMAANFPMIDSDLKAVSNTGVGTATELVTGTVHALTRADRDRNVFKFVATSNFEAGETFEVDGTQVTAKTPDGRNLSTGAYVINSTVLCMLEGTLLTVLVNPAKALDSENLDGHPATYFATAAALSALDNQLGAVSSKVGTGVLDVGNDCVDGINTLNTQLSWVDITNNCAWNSGLTFVYNKCYKRGNELKVVVSISPVNFISGAVVVTLPYFALGKTYDSGLCLDGLSVPTTEGYSLTIDDNDKTLVARKSTNTNYIATSVIISIRE